MSGQRLLRRGGLVPFTLLSGFLILGSPFLADVAAQSPWSAAPGSPQWTAPRDDLGRDRWGQPGYEPSMSGRNAPTERGPSLGVSSRGPGSPWDPAPRSSASTVASPSSPQTTTQTPWGKRLPNSPAVQQSRSPSWTGGPAAMAHGMPVNSSPFQPRDPRNVGSGRLNATVSGHPGQDANTTSLSFGAGAAGTSNDQSRDPRSRSASSSPRSPAGSPPIHLLRNANTGRVVMGIDPSPGAYGSNDADRPQATDGATNASRPAGNAADPSSESQPTVSGWEIQNPSGRSNYYQVQGTHGEMYAPNSYFGPEHQRWAGMTVPPNQRAWPANMSTVPPLARTGGQLAPNLSVGPQYANWSNMWTGRTTPSANGSWNYSYGR
jgi:hypothetical protein